MKILNWYVTKNFLISFFMSIGILTFCMVGGRLVPELERIAKGVPPMAVGEFIYMCMPVVLTFTIPLAVIVSIMLVFGRLSADSEITAMRACGVSILQVMSPLLIIAIGLSGLCLYLLLQVGPPMLEKSKNVFEKVLIDQPMALFVPGESIAQGNVVLYANDVQDNELLNLQIFQLNPDGSLSDLRAERGVVTVDAKTQKVNIALINCEGVTSYENEQIHTRADKFEISFDYGRAINRNAISQRYKYMSVRNLLASIRMLKARGQETCDLEVELNQRIAFGLSPLAFLLLGLPLAIHASRRETSVGLFIGAIAGGFYFLSIILCESLTNYPKLYPQYLLWLPNLTYQAVGAIMVYRITKR